MFFRYTLSVVSGLVHVYGNFPSLREYGIFWYDIGNSFSQIVTNFAAGSDDFVNAYRHCRHTLRIRTRIHIYLMKKQL